MLEMLSELSWGEIFTIIGGVIGVVIGSIILTIVLIVFNILTMLLRWLLENLVKVVGAIITLSFIGGLIWSVWSNVNVPDVDSQQTQSTISNPIEISNPSLPPTSIPTLRPQGDTAPSLAEPTSAPTPISTQQPPTLVSDTSVKPTVANSEPTLQPLLPTPTQPFTPKIDSSQGCPRPETCIAGTINNLVLEIKGTVQRGNFARYELLTSPTAPLPQIPKPKQHTILKTGYTETFDEILFTQSIPDIPSGDWIYIVVISQDGNYWDTPAAIQINY